MQVVRVYQSPLPLGCLCSTAQQMMTNSEQTSMTYPFISSQAEQRERRVITGRK